MVNSRDSNNSNMASMFQIGIQPQSTGGNINKKSDFTPRKEDFIKKHINIDGGNSSTFKGEEEEEEETKTNDNQASKKEIHTEKELVEEYKEKGVSLSVFKEIIDTVYDVDEGVLANFNIIVQSLEIAYNERSKFKKTKVYFNDYMDDLKGSMLFLFLNKDLKCDNPL